MTLVSSSYSATYSSRPALFVLFISSGQPETLFRIINRLNDLSIFPTLIKYLYGQPLQRGYKSYPQHEFLTRMNKKTTAHSPKIPANIPQTARFSPASPWIAIFFRARSPVTIAPIQAMKLRDRHPIPLYPTVKKRLSGQIPPMMANQPPIPARKLINARRLVDGSTGLSRFAKSLGFVMAFSHHISGNCFIWLCGNSGG